MNLCDGYSIVKPKKNSFCLASYRADWSRFVVRHTERAVCINSYRLNSQLAAEPEGEINFLVCLRFVRNVPENVTGDPYFYDVWIAFDPRSKKSYMTHSSSGWYNTPQNLPEIPNPDGVEHFTTHNIVSYHMLKSRQFDLMKILGPEVMKKYCSRAASKIKSITHGAYIVYPKPTVAQVPGVGEVVLTLRG